MTQNPNKTDIEKVIDRQDKDIKKENTKKLELFYKIIHIVNTVKNLTDLIKNTLNLILELMNFDGGGVYFINEFKRTAEIIYQKGLPSKFLKEIKSVNIDDTPYNLVFIKGESIFTENYRKINPEHSKLHKFLSIASVPLIAHNKILGALNIGSEKRFIFTAEEKESLLSIGREMGNAIVKIKAEKALIESESNFETLFNSIYDSIFVLDMKGKILKVNQTVLNTFGYSESEIQNMHILDLHPPNRRDEAAKILADMIAGKTDSCSIPSITKKGVIIPLETKISRGNWGNQEVLYGISRDITERIKAEEKIRESEEKYRFLFENSPFFIILIDIHGYIRDLNPAFEELSGYPKNELIEKSFKEHPLFPKNYLKLLLKRQEQILKGLSLPLMELKIKKKNNRLRWVDISLSKIELDNIIYIQIMGHDITYRKRAEKEILNAYDRTNFYKDLFAHDMKNILHSISSSIELYSIIKKHPEKLNELNELFEIIEEQTNRGSKLISDVNKLSKIEKSKISKVHIKILPILDEAIELIKKSYQNRNLKINLNFEEKKDYFVRANGLLLDVFENILINSVKHNDNPDVEIQIKISKETKRRKNYIKMQFIDNGVGIPDVRKDNIFQRSSQKSVSGMGIGLSLVKFIIDSFDGDILVKNRIRGDYTKGSNFVIFIPSA